MTADALADVKDSVVNANPEAVEHPAEWGLEETDDLPDWAAQASPSPAR
jgi:hypothetical protein